MADSIGDLIARHMDWPGADKVAERLKCFKRSRSSSMIAKGVRWIVLIFAAIGGLQTAIWFSEWLSFHI